MSKQSLTSRRDLFKGFARQVQGKNTELQVLRPPGALDESLFIETCERCDKCIRACAPQIITPGDGGFPQLDFTSAGCTGCSDCITACPSGALTQPIQWPLGQLSFSDRCLAQQSITCQSCKDACDQQAISFPITTKTPTPVLASNQCSGCGECVSVCPVNAISITPVTQQERVSA